MVTGQGLQCQIFSVLERQIIQIVSFSLPLSGLLQQVDVHQPLFAGSPGRPRPLLGLCWGCAWFRCLPTWVSLLHGSSVHGISGFPSQFLLCDSQYISDSGWWALSRIYRCLIIILDTWNYIMLLTNVTPNKFNLKKIKQSLPKLLKGRKCLSF